MYDMTMPATSVSGPAAVLRFAPEAAVGGNLALGVAGGLAGMPLVVLNNAGWEQLGVGEASQPKVVALRESRCKFAGN
jgi:hypothetical protein